MKTTARITSKTSLPWTIARTIVLEDGTELEAVCITAEDRDFAHGGDWFADLSGVRFAGLTDDQRDEAMDAASDILSGVDYRLSNGGVVFGDEAEDGDHEARFESDLEDYAAAMVELRHLDANGAATIDDGSLDDLTLAEQTEAVRAAVAAIKAAR